jgi:hypothetical protein
MRTAAPAKAPVRAALAPDSLGSPAAAQGWEASASIEAAAARPAPRLLNVPSSFITNPLFDRVAQEELRPDFDYRIGNSAIRAWASI